VFVYAVDENEPTKRAVARELLNSTDPARIVISTQVLQELYSCLTRKVRRRFDEASAEAAVHELLQFLTMRVDVPIIQSAMASNRKWRTAIWDALILETARSAGCAKVITEDMQHGQRFGDLVIENPFRDV